VSGQLDLLDWHTGIRNPNLLRLDLLRGLDGDLRDLITVGWRRKRRGTVSVKRVATMKVFAAQGNWNGAALRPLMNTCMRFIATSFV
jgi:hypothetical protein